MQRHKVQFLKSGRRHSRSQQRGVALITTLLLLMLLSGLALAMAWSTRSDMLINGYYRSFRGSFYAADSGLNIGRQEIQNKVMSEIQPGWNAAVPPFVNPTQTASDAHDDIATNYASYTCSNCKINGSGQAASSWPAAYKIVQDVQSGTAVPFVTYVGCVIQDNTPCAGATIPITQYKYQFNYDLVAVGQSRGGEAATVQDHGSLIITAPLTAAGGNTSFAAWGMFIDQFPICSGTLVPGTITGPTFTNGAWTFGTGSTGYTFTDPVGSVSSNFGYQFSNTCDKTSAPSDKQGNTTIAPNFKAGYNLNQSKIQLPQNDFNQKRAVLDGIGASNNPVNNNDLNKGLLDITGAPYPNNGASSGVFLPYTTKDALGNTIAPKFTGGGIYVEGNANITLTPLGTSAQIYTITQGSTTTTVTIDPVANTTTMVTGGTTQVITGVPTQLDPTTLAPKGYDTMLYVDGTVTSLSGPGEGLPAIQDHTALTITAASDVNITGDIRYKQEPVTTAAVGSIPIDTLIPANDTRQALGIFTATGNLILNDTQKNSLGSFDGMLEIDASLAAISNNGSGGLVNNGAQIDTLTIVGGRIQNTIQDIKTNTRNVVFDKRFSSGWGPPWFPSTNLTSGLITPGTPVAKFSRLQWVNHTPFD
jgi:Tfp pilus assembly protein PilX